VAAPLEGLRVLDISEGIAGPFCAKLLGDLGAEVVKVESPGGGDSARTPGPSANGNAPDGDAQASGSFIFLNTSKSGVTIDLDATEGRELFARMLDRYDIVVSGETEGELAARGLGYEQLQQWNPTVILTTVTGFGSTGPYAGYRWSHIITCAVGGWAINCGRPERNPLQAGGSIAETFAGAYAAVGTQLAVLGRTAHGGGDHVDVSAQEAAITAASFPTLSWEYRQMLNQRNSHRGPGPSFILPTTDGHVGVNVLTGPQWDMLCSYFGQTDMIDDPRFQPGQRQLNADEAGERFAPHTVDRTAEEVFHDGQTWRVPFGLVPNMEGIAKMLPHQEREFFVEVGSPETGPVAVPGIAYKSTVNSTAITPPPAAGEHNDHVFGELLGLSADEIAELSSEGVI
jgi:crotonobetainyl-CoA:carnitine CoA-transferase CaiB-like acyl-CoA transferase